VDVFGTVYIVIVMNTYMN